jgi:hypothetical protein
MASQVVSWRMDSIKIVSFQSNLESAKIGFAPQPGESRFYPRAGGRCADRTILTVRPSHGKIINA